MKVKREGPTPKIPQNPKSKTETQNSGKRTTATEKRLALIDPTVIPIHTLVFFAGYGYHTLRDIVTRTTVWLVRPLVECSAIKVGLAVWLKATGATSHLNPPEFSGHIDIDLV